MSNTARRPFTAATDKAAFAQVFTRSTLVHRDADPSRRAARRSISLLHRRAPRP